MENKLQKLKNFQYSIPVVVIATGIFLASFISSNISSLERPFSGNTIWGLTNLNHSNFCFFISIFI